MPPFEVRAEVRSLSDSHENDVAYSVLRCQGNWAYLGRSAGGYRFREVIDSGAGGSCKGTGLVTLVPTTPNTARYAFHGGGVVSRGLLLRTDER